MLAWSRRKTLARFTAIGVAAVVAMLIPLSLCGAAVSWATGGVTVCDTTGSQVYPKAVADGTGGTVSVWKDNRGASDAIYAQRLNSSGTRIWGTTGKVVCDVTGTKSWPSICGDGAGGAVLAWEEKRGTVWDIYMQKLNSAGNRVWATSGVCMEPFNADMHCPVLVSDGSGGGIVTYYGSGGIFINRVDSTGTPKWSGIYGKLAGYCSNPPAIVANGRNGAYVIWNNGGQIWGNHFNVDGGENWNTSNGLKLTTGAKVSSITCAACPDSSGSVLFAWTDNRSGNNDIYANKVVNITIGPASSGIVYWGATGKIVSSATTDQSEPDICSDGASGAIVSFTDNAASNNWDVYAQRLNTGGTRTWGNNGVAVAVRPYTQWCSKVCMDGANGAFLAYHDLPNSGGLRDLRAVRLTSAGVKSWDNEIADPYPAAYGGDDPAVGSVIYMGSSKAVIYWSDDRGNATWTLPHTGEGCYAQQVY